MLALTEAMEQLMRNAFIRPMRWPFEEMATVPPMDVVETPEGFTVKASLPGWKPEDVEVTIENGQLTIRGEWKQEEEHKDDKRQWHQREIRHSSFERRVLLPVEVEADKATARFENGVLTLSIPKAEVVKPKQIKIEVK
ncbi:MAG: Hsp20/alpha crystallin family protein [Thermoflexales bacterium]|nr:Hsp20/alpha crystallin family protein [Thermoflexales bacterium]